MPVLIVTGPLIPALPLWMWNPVNSTAAGKRWFTLNVTLAAVKSQWSHAFEVQTRLAALEEALTSAKRDLAGPSGVDALMALKAERDALRRDIKTGRIWSPGEPS